MSTELTLFRDKTAVMPTHPIPGGDALTKSLMGADLSAKRISIKGNVFRMLVGGKEVAKSEERFLDVVIVAAAPKTSRTYYAENFKEGVATLPDCWSNDGVKPDPKSEKPQASNCANCPMNVAGSGQGTSRACRYSRRLAVVLANNCQDADALTANLEHSEVYQLVLPAQSIFGKVDNGKMPLEAYASFIHGNGLTINSVVTEMRFDTSSATPKLTFRAVKPLDVEQITIVVDKGNSPAAQAAIDFNPAQTDGVKSNPIIEGQAEKPAAKKAEVFRDAPAKAKPASIAAPEDEDEEAPAPTVRASKKTVVEDDGLDDLLGAWASDDN